MAFSTVDFPAASGDHVLDQRRDVLAPLAQRRHLDLSDVDPVQQVLPEQALGHHVVQVAIGGRDDAHVHPGGCAVGTHRYHLAVLEKPQQHRLHAQAHLADFVEEDRAAVRLLELPDFVAIGAGEAALHMTEELRFEQGLGDAGAVQRHEPLRRTRGVHVDEAGQDILADAALAGDQHLRVAGGQPPGHLQRPLKGRTRADHSWRGNWTNRRGTRGRGQLHALRVSK